MVTIRCLDCSQLLLKESYSFSKLLYIVYRGGGCLRYNSYPPCRHLLLANPSLFLLTFPLLLKSHFLKEGHKAGRGRSSLQVKLHHQWFVV